MAIPKNTSVGIFVHFLHRNPLVWTDPDKFDPERFMDEVILFNVFKNFS
jgi:cytochrome P450